MPEDSRTSVPGLPDRPVYLCGMMGSGKTTVGRLLAARLGRPFLDLDEVVEAEAGRTVAELFRAEGERGFRERESAALREVARRGAVVVGLGGGALTRTDNLALVRATGTLVWLQAPVEVLAGRIAADEERRAGTRPLVAGEGDLVARLSALLDARFAFYDQAHARIDASRPADEVAGAIAEHLVSAELASTLPPVRGAAPAQTVRLELGARSYGVEVTVGADQLVPALEAAGVLPLGGRAALIADATAFALHGRRLLEALAPLDLPVIEVPPGEEHKRLSELERLAERCVASGLDRGSVLFALGGGVVGDLAGLLAATLYRGIPFVQLPTTLLAQVDASIGGKTAVDLPSGKNLLGAFHQPRLVYADVTTLATLPRREWASGLGEVVKYGLIAAPEVLELLERSAPDRMAHDAGLLVELVSTCARIKARIVSADELERGTQRRLLNLGHTIGHAIESASGFALAHGEAVALGLVAAVRVSRAAGVLGEPDLERRLAALLARLGLPHELEPHLREDVLRRVGVDKKRAGAEVAFICLRRAGEPVTVRIPVAELPGMLAAA